MKGVGDEKSGDQVDDRVHDAAAELLEVLEEAHSGQFCAF